MAEILREGDEISLLATTKQCIECPKNNSCPLEAFKHRIKTTGDDEVQLKRLAERSGVNLESYGQDPKDKEIASYEYSCGKTSNQAGVVLIESKYTDQLT